MGTQLPRQWRKRENLLVVARPKVGACENCHTLEPRRYRDLGRLVDESSWASDHHACKSESQLSQVQHTTPGKQGHLVDGQDPKEWPRSKTVGGSRLIH